MKLSLFLLATLALGANAANYLCWCTVDGYYSEYYTKLSCWRKYKKYLKYSNANSRDECWRKPGDTLTDWTEKCTSTGASGGSCDEYPDDK
ncbi:hypothetical protein Cob_v009223 [Colletotrichum orbiculare MAFF 240422]|uniref:Secreted protein n=1 Tax=Colletotrichum orbiculare (strain 104-T / ATCC 96160 / CBS 514.97 / LARS 414 / MAFF 240422) TaxID=1213857 RepID=A0A484FIQ5_COLOR|nr:hypothetical protein Cob_v009223 [Colletotrichum orbiculare MAFF 240422]